MFLSEWREFPSAPCLAGKKETWWQLALMLLKSRASLTCTRACFLPGRAKDLSAHRYLLLSMAKIVSRRHRNVTVLCTVHCLSCSTTLFFLIFCWPCISIYLFININQLDALNFYNKFISCLYMFRAHVLIVRRAKIVSYSLWYHHTETSEWSKITKILIELYFNNFNYFSNFRPLTCFSVMIPETV